MTNSVVSEYENVSVKEITSESLLYQAVNNVLSITTTNGNKIFCPLCIQTYEFKCDLLDHLKNAHFNFLSRTNEQSYLCEECPFCFANFFGRHTVVRHALYNHSKVIAQLYLRTGKDGENCYFCGETNSKKNASQFMCHIEQKHFLKFTVLFEEQFMNVNDSLSFIKGGSRSPSNGNILNALKSEPGEKFFDLTCLKEQLNNVELNQSRLKSILKSTNREEKCTSKCTHKGGVHSMKKMKACRILNFDTPDGDNEKSVFIQNIHSPKQITFAEHSLLCGKDKGEQGELLNRCSNQPLHSSTPIMKRIHNTNENICKPFKSKGKHKPTFVSYFYKNDYIFKCGKCSKQFRDNGELNFHIKKNHKMFILDLLHPCYQCAICKAKFFKNHYLKKHIKLHTSHNKSFISDF